jgi:hypothetical protein
VEDEKKSLERRREILMATKIRLAGDDESGDSGKQSVDNSQPEKELSTTSSVPPIENRPIENLPNEKKPELMTPVAEKPDDISEKDSNDDILDEEEDDDFDEIEEDDDDAAEEDRKAAVDTNNTPVKADSSQPKSEDYNRATSATSAAPDQAGDIFNKTKELTTEFRNAINGSKDNMDREYLVKVIDAFERSVNHLRDRSSKVEMNESQKVRAIKGRLVLYVKSIQDEFLFSELLNEKIATKIKDIFSLK